MAAMVPSGDRQNVESINRMQIFTRIKNQIPPRRFVGFLTVIAALWFCGLYPYLCWNDPKSLPKSAVPGKEISLPLDFDQYYIGAFLAKNGLWDALYPTPRRDVYDSPSTFKPKINTFLFNKAKASRNPAYYPSIASGGAYPPELLARFPEIAKCRHSYFYPPPLAIILSPLAFFDSATAAYKIWPTICIIAMFGTCIFLSRIYRALHGGATYTEGFLIGVFLLYSGVGGTTISDGNVTPILSFLLAFCAYAWMRGWQTSFGAAVIPLLLFKGIGLSWCPLLLLGKIRWKSISAMAFLTVVLNGATIYLAGTRVYSVFLNDILPKASVPLGDGVVGRIFNVFGFYPKPLYLIVSVSLLAAIYYLYWKRCRETSSVKNPSIAVAALAGAISIFCLFNFSSYINYTYNYLYFPFLGWLMWEYNNTMGRWHSFVLVSLLTGSTWILASIFDLNSDWTFSHNALGVMTLLARFIYCSSAWIAQFVILLIAFRRLSTPCEVPHVRSAVPSA
jgi:hypothetical protein